jgi:DNA-binding CsgD family transcriptional regulator
MENQTQTRWVVPKGQLPYRQASTLEGIAAGKSDKEMASDAGVSRAVIANAVQTLYYRLGMGKGRRGQLVAVAIRQGVLTATSLVMIVCTLSLIATIDTDTPYRPRPSRMLRVKTTSRSLCGSLLIA